MFFTKAFLRVPQGDMDLALESYDVCTGLLQSKPKNHEGKHYTIYLPNLRMDAAISVEEVLKRYFTLFVFKVTIEVFLVFTTTFCA